MNNLYGHTMSQYLPYADFKWVKNIDKIEQKLMQIKKDGSTGDILEVALEYPEKLHNIHNNCPLAPEKINIPKEGYLTILQKLQMLIILLQEKQKN